MNKRTGFTEIAGREILNKISEIRTGWAKTKELPKKLTIPFTGEKIHFDPFWMMEFRDEQGQRRFFRMEDQLEKATNEALMFLQSQLDDSVENERLFKIGLQKQLDLNLEREDKLKRRRKRKD